MFLLQCIIGDASGCSKKKILKSLSRFVSGSGFFKTNAKLLPFLAEICRLISKLCVDFKFRTELLSGFGSRIQIKKQISGQNQEN